MLLERYLIRTLFQNVTNAWLYFVVAGCYTAQARPRTTAPSIDALEHGCATQSAWRRTKESGPGGPASKGGVLIGCHLRIESLVGVRRVALFSHNTNLHSAFIA